jgi:hypothetical protein
LPAGATLAGAGATTTRADATEHAVGFAAEVFVPHEPIGHRTGEAAFQPAAKGLVNERIAVFPGRRRHTDPGKPEPHRLPMEFEKEPIRIGGGSERRGGGQRHGESTRGVKST